MSKYSFEMFVIRKIRQTDDVKWHDINMYNLEIK